jgi:dTDP-4-amino-4,6-dideoxygalactose transaminase
LAGLPAAGFKVIRPDPRANSVYHLYVVEVANRDQTLAHLAAAGIGAGVHYPVPLHLQPALADWGIKRGTLPKTEAAADRVLSLPICADLTDSECDRVCDVFLACAKP